MSRAAVAAIERRRSATTPASLAAGGFRAALHRRSTPRRAGSAH